MPSYREERYIHLRNVVDDNYKSFTELKDPEWFLTWLWKNIPVYDEFERWALRLYRSGHSYYTARSIMYDMTLKHKENKKFKVHPHATPYMSRLVMFDNPELEGFFGTRAPSKNKGKKDEDGSDDVRSNSKEDNPREKRGMVQNRNDRRTSRPPPRTRKDPVRPVRQARRNR